MKIAIVSDVHSNLEALNAALRAVDKEMPDLVVSCGDIVGYGPEPNECIKIFKERKIVNVLGNHDAACIGKHSTRDFRDFAKQAVDFTMRTLTEDSIAYLNSLKEMENAGNTLIVHGSPREPITEYLDYPKDAKACFDIVRNGIILVGHTHIPIIYELEHGKINEIPIENEEEVKLKPGNRYILNAGSVGQPRDLNPAAAYGILDLKKKVFAVKRVPYDIPSVQIKMRNADIPEFLIDRLGKGI